MRGASNKTTENATDVEKAKQALLKKVVFVEKKVLGCMLAPVTKILLIYGLIRVYEVIVAWIFTALEGWSFEEAHWYTTVTLTTVGYGDFSPRTPGGRVFFIFVTIGGVSLFGTLLGSIGEFMMNKFTIISACVKRASKRAVSKIKTIKGKKKKQQQQQQQDNDAENSTAKAANAQQ